jgi:hypothetical protein
LTLPCALLVVHLFLSDTENRILGLLDRVNKLNQPAVAGVLLFAMAYSLGSAVSLIAQDFFDDDDLHIRILEHVFRVGVTETSIRTDVYCQKRWLVTQTLFDSFADKHESFWTRDSPCQYTGSWIIPLARYQINRGEGRVGEVFRIQEAELLMKGSDANERLRQFHDQIMVLRGAAFDGGRFFVVLVLVEREISVQAALVCVVGLSLTCSNCIVQPRSRPSLQSALHGIHFGGAGGGGLVLAGATSAQGKRCAGTAARAGWARGVSSRLPCPLVVSHLRCFLGMVGHSGAVWPADYLLFF